MKEKIHPNYVDCIITCSCGNIVKTRSTKQKINVEICSACHPFFSGKQKMIDVAGRVEKYRRRSAKKSAPKTTKTAEAS